LGLKIAILRTEVTPWVYKYVGTPHFGMAFPTNGGSSVESLFCGIASAIRSCCHVFETVGTLLRA